MPRGIYRRKTKVTVPGNGHDTSVPASEVPFGTLTALPWWNKLEALDQSAVAKEDRELTHQLLVNSQSRLAIGKSLEAIRARLEPHGLFGRYIKYKKFKRTIAYRRINEYKNSMANLPEPVVKVAMERNINILGESQDKPLGVYTDAVAALPPPANITDAQASTYLDQLEEVRRKMKSEPTISFDIPVSDPRVITKAIFKFADNQLRKVENPKMRVQILNNVTGMLLKKYEMPATTFAPKSIPEDFTIGRGKPRTAVAQTAVA